MEHEGVAPSLHGQVVHTPDHNVMITGLDDLLRRTVDVGDTT